MASYMASYKLNLKTLVEIDDLIDTLMLMSGKTYDEVESALMNECLYPEGSNCCFAEGTVDCMAAPKGWLANCLIQLLKDNNVERFYITHAI